MNKRGFTLVELLAVIIILTLLALLTSTAVTKLVKDSKQDLSDAQKELIKSAAEIWGADNLTKLPDAGKCSYLTLSDLKEYGLIDSNVLEPNNSQPMLNDLKIKVTATVGSQGNYVINYEVDPESIEGCYQQLYNDGDIVYFDVTTGTSCTNYHVDNSKTGYNGFNGTGNQNGCLKFYTFLDNGSKVNLLLDHNTTSTIAWTNNETTQTSQTGPIDLIQKLKSDTNSWVGTENLSDYVYRGSSRNYVIDYTDYKARLITGEEISKIIGVDDLSNDNNPCTDHDDATICKYSWLYDRTNLNCKEYGCYNNSDVEMDGYWTSFANSSFYQFALGVAFDGDISNYTVSNSNSLGVRPVIEISKEKIKS